MQPHDIVFFIMKPSSNSDNCSELMVASTSCVRSPHHDMPAQVTITYGMLLSFNMKLIRAERQWNYITMSLISYVLSVLKSVPPRSPETPINRLVAATTIP